MFRLAPCLALLVLLAAPLQRVLSAEPIAVAIADFDYTDTSGEPLDQDAAHRARLAAFMGAIRAALEAGGRYRVVGLTCKSPPCTASTVPPAVLIASARAVGAQRLLYGGIHKMSSLIQNGKVQMVDLADNRLVFDRLLTFRGDNDEAWQRAERFIVRELAENAAQ